MGRTRTLDHFLTKLFGISCYIAGGASCVMMLLSVVNVVARVLFKAPVYGAIEIVSYGALICAALAAAQNELDDGNATMTLFIDIMRPKVKAFFLALSHVLCAIFYAVISYRFFLNISDSIVNNQFTQTLSMPMGIFYAVLFVGFLLLCITSLLKMARQVCFILGKDYLHTQDTSEGEGAREK